MKRIWIHMYDGQVQWVLTDGTESIEVLLTDENTEGAEDDEIRSVLFDSGEAEVYVQRLKAHPALEKRTLQGAFRDTE